MKKLLSLTLAAFMLAMTLCSCGNTLNNSTDTSNDDTPTDKVTTEEVTTEAPASLQGEWIQKDYENEGTYMTATVSDNAIEVNWYVKSESGDTTALYWAGTYTAPDKAGDFSWESINDTEKTSTALLASSDEKKTFNFSNNEISFEASAMGATKTVVLIRK